MIHAFLDTFLQLSHRYGFHALSPLLLAGPAVNFTGYIVAYALKIVNALPAQAAARDLLVGMDFYDAAVRLDDVSAVVVKARNK